MRAVQEAKKRITPGVKHVPGEDATFFSVHDVWLYDARLDSKVCPVCRANEDYADAHGGFRGDHLRAHFPYLEIVDVATIKAKVHPNCRCLLLRKMSA